MSPMNAYAANIHR